MGDCESVPNRLGLTLTKKEEKKEEEKSDMVTLEWLFQLGKWK